MRFSDFFRENFWIFLILLVSFVVHLFFFFDHHPLWWDSGVYLGMGKYIFSFGTVGLWEHIRPILWPIILGFFWKFSLPVVFFARFLQLFMFLSSVFLVYLIAKKFYSKYAALIAASLLASSSILFYLSFHIYTEIPAMFFLLLSYFFFIEKRFFWSGVFVSLSFLTKFPMGIFAVILFSFISFKKKRKLFFDFIFGLFVVLFPFFLSNLIFYGNFFGGVLDASSVIRKVLGCNVLRPQPWYYYFFLLFFYENKFFLVSVLGLFNRFRKSFLIIVSAVLPLLYFMSLSCRDYRYLVVFLPFAALLVGSGFDFVFSRFKKKKYLISFVLILLVAVSFIGYRNSLNFYSDNEESFIQEQQDYFSYLSDKSVSGAVWTSNPSLSAYSDVLLSKIYYPIYDADVSRDFFDYLKENTVHIEFVFLDNCGGGIICHPDDVVCEQRNDELISFLDDNFDLVFDKSHGRCWYKIYRNPVFV